MKTRYKYTLEWDGKMARYKQEFESLEEARMALALHRHCNACIKVRLIRDEGEV